MNKLSALWKGASYQDNLLQSYRNFNLIVQSAFTVTGAIVAVFILSLEQQLFQWLTYFCLLTISTVSIIVSWRMKALIASRAQDVDYYHNQIIQQEQLLPKEERVLTDFKVYQKFGRDQQKQSGPSSDIKIDDALIARLIDKGKGHSRMFLDHQLMYAFYCVWICFHLVGLLSIFLPA